MTGKREAGSGTRNDLLEFLRSRRWFGDKGREIRDVALSDVIPVQWPGSDREYAVARARVVTNEGTSTYQLFLVPGEMKMTDALEDADFRRGLADAFFRGAQFEQAGTRWIVESESKQPLKVPAASPVTLSPSEQTNSSIIIDREAILKLFRRIEPGIHPDVEVTRFLTLERVFVHVPVLLGTIRFEDREGAGNATIAGMLQELVPGAVVGWQYALDCSRTYFESGSAPDSDLPFEDEAEQLGGVTRALHEALASGDPGSEFDLRPASRDDVRGWARKAAEMIHRASGSLERAIADKQLPREHAKAAQSVIERVPDYLRWIEELAGGIDADAGAKTRTHGDFHLGQVLRSSAKQFLIIDFEGEPLRPLNERRGRHSPLRDVAGMLRSFAYAAAMGSGLGAVGVKAHSAKPTASVRAGRWERAARDAFLHGYFSEQHGRAGLLPHSQTNAGRVLALFETEKAFYELQYELDHRPDWVWIPLHGIAELHR